MIKKIISAFTMVSFLLLGLMPYQDVFAQEQLYLPPAGQIMPLSRAFTPLMIKGLKIHKDDPFEFDFIINQGQENLSQAQFKEASLRLVKYFLASLTIPENDLWVNLSPYEKNRITTPELGVTEMGKDLLSQDYVLKQLTSSLIYPEGKTGKKFWSKVYALAQEKYNTTNIPINTFNKVWIVPQKAVVYENSTNQTAYVVESSLKVMLEEDYLALQKHSALSSIDKAVYERTSNSIGNQIVREIVIPELTKEVNEGKNFANLRQITNSLILAAWFKRALKASILAKLYVDQKKIIGVDLEDRTVRERIYQQYLRAYKKGVYNYIKEEADPVSHEMIPRKYFSGGVVEKFDVSNLEIKNAMDPAQLSRETNDRAVTVALNNTLADGAMLSGTKEQDNRDRKRIEDEQRAERVRGVFQPLVDSVKDRLERFGGLLDTPQRQQAFGNANIDEVQAWLNKNKENIKNILPLIPGPGRFERYKRNLILSIKIPGLGFISLYVHRAKINNGTGPHLHGISIEEEKEGGFVEEKEIGEMAFVAALEDGLKEIRYPDVTHSSGPANISLVNPIETKLEPFKATVLVDKVYGAHRIEYTPKEIVKSNRPIDESGPFLELYVYPEPFQGFDSLFPEGDPNGTAYMKIPAGSSLWVQHERSVLAVAIKEGWQRIPNRLPDRVAAQGEVLRSLYSSSPSPFRVFVYPNAHAILLDADEINKVFNNIKFGDRIYRDGVHRFYLILKSDRAMVAAPFINQDNWPVRFKVATIEQARNPNNINQLASGIIRTGEFSFKQQDIDNRFDKPVKLAVIGGGASGLATAFQAVDSKLDGVVLFEAGFIAQAFTNAAQPFEDMRTPPKRFSLVQLGPNSKDSQYLNLQNPDNLSRFRSLALEGEKVEAEAFGANTKMARPKGYDTDLINASIPTARAVAYQHFITIANAIVSKGGLIEENDPVVSVDKLESGFFEITTRKGIRVIAENVVLATGAGSEKLQEDLQKLATNRSINYAVFGSQQDIVNNNFKKLVEFNNKIPVFKSQFLYDPRIIEYLKKLPLNSAIAIVGGGQSAGNAAVFVHRFRPDIVLHLFAKAPLTRGPSQMPSGLRTQRQMTDLVTTPQLQQEAWEKGGPSTFGVPVTLAVYDYLQEAKAKGTFIEHIGDYFDEKNYSIRTDHDEEGRIVAVVTHHSNPKEEIRINGGFISAVGYTLDRPAREFFYQGLVKEGLVSLNSNGEVEIAPDGLTSSLNKHIFVTGIGLGTEGSPTDGTTHGPTIRSREIVEEILKINKKVEERDLIAKITSDYKVFSGITGENERAAAFLTFAANQPGEDIQSIEELYKSALRSNSIEEAARYIADVAGQSGKIFKSGFHFIAPEFTESPEFVQESLNRVFATEQPGYLGDAGRTKILILFDTVKVITKENEATEQLLYPVTQIGIGLSESLRLYYSFIHKETKDPLVAALLVRAAKSYLPPHINDRGQVSIAPGGIDLNTANLDLQIKRDGQGIPLAAKYQNLENIHINGLTPIIINIVPITNLSEFLKV